jgi:hypothetical protein
MTEKQTIRELPCQILLCYNQSGVIIGNLYRVIIGHLISCVIIGHLISGVIIGHLISGVIGYLIQVSSLVTLIIAQQNLARKFDIK